MNKPKLLCLFLIASFLFLTHTGYAQNFDTRLNFEDTTQVHLLQLKSGKKLKGRIKSLQNEELTFQKKNSDSLHLFTLSEIRRIRVQGGVSWFNRKYNNPIAYNAHLLYTPTAFNLKKGQKSYRTHFGASLLYNYALSDGISIGAGLSFPFMVSANLKGSIQASKKYRIGYKITALSTPALTLGGEAFLVFEHALSQSFGTPDRFVNIAVNYYRIIQDMYYYNDYIPERFFSVSLGGGYRFTENWQILVEKKITTNKLFLDVNLLPSVIISWINKKNNISFGFQSRNNRGLNHFPIFEVDTDDIVTFSRRNIAKLPYLSYSRIF